MPLLPTGLLVAGGLGQGLSSFTDTFLKAKQQGNENRRANAMTGLLANKQGYDYDPTTGAVNQNALGQAQQQGLLAKSQLGAAQSQNALRDLNESNDPDSDTAQATNSVHAALGKYLTKKGYGDLGDTLADEDISPRVKSLITEHPAMKELLSGAKSDSDFQKALAVATIRGNATTEAAGTRADAAGAKGGLHDSDAAFKAVQAAQKPFDQQIDQAQNLRKQTNLALTDPTANRMLPLETVRTLVNRVNDRELRMASGGQDAMDVASRMAKSLTQGTMTQNDYKQLNDWIDLMEQGAEEKKGMAEDKIIRYHAKTRGLDQDEVTNTMLGHDSWATRQKDKADAVKAEETQKTGLLGGGAFSPDVVQYASKHGITNAQAAAIKAQRIQTGVK